MKLTESVCQQIVLAVLQFSNSYTRQNIESIKGEVKDPDIEVLLYPKQDIRPFFNIFLDMFQLDNININELISVKQKHLYLINIDKLEEMVLKLDFEKLSEAARLRLASCNGLDFLKSVQSTLINQLTAGRMFYIKNKKAMSKLNYLHSLFASQQEKNLLASRYKYFSFPRNRQKFHEEAKKSFRRKLRT